MGFFVTSFPFRLLTGAMSGTTRDVVDGVSRRSVRGYVEELGRATDYVSSFANGDSVCASPFDQAELGSGLRNAGSIRTSSSMDSMGDYWVGGLVNGSSAQREGTESPIYVPPPKVKQDGKPANFALVAPGVYRSSFPMVEDYAFLNSLRLKTIVTLRKTTLEPHYSGFMKMHGINHKMFDMQGTKKAAIPVSMMQDIMAVVLDQRNHPLLIHCNQGLHRTGCTAAILKLVYGHDLESTIQEYKDFAAYKVRECDVAYIRSYNINGLQASMIDAKQTASIIPSERRGKSIYTVAVVIILLCILFVFQRLLGSRALDAHLSR